MQVDRSSTAAGSGVRAMKTLPTTTRSASESAARAFDRDLSRKIPLSADERNFVAALARWAAHRATDPRRPPATIRSKQKHENQMK